MGVGFGRAPSALLFPRPTLLSYAPLAHFHNFIHTFNKRPKTHNDFPPLVSNPPPFCFLVLMSTAIFLRFTTVVVLMCSFSLTLTCADNVTEILALLTFKQNVDDPLGVMDGWDSSTPSAPCDWRGIGCYQGQVRELRLPRLQLRGRLTEQLGNLRQLRRLSLHSNNLNGSIPSAIAQCVLLRAIYLQDNSLSGNLPPAMSNLANLQVLNVAHNFLSGEFSGALPAILRVLDLSSNLFSGAIPSNVSASSHLELINLSFNQFSGEIPATLGYLARLQYLWVDSNQLYGTIPSAISNCSSLIHLSAGDNNLEGLIPATIGSLPNLRVISLQHNQLSGVVPTSMFCNNTLINAHTIRIVELSFNRFTGIENLASNALCSIAMEVLDVHGNQIDNDFPEWLMSVWTLKVLDISGNFISGVLPNDVGNLIFLEELRGANNSLTGGIPDNIRKCGLLRVLDLGGNQLSSLIPDFLGELKGLKVLSLGENGFSGTIPVSFGGLYQLESLDLSNNKLNGTVPQELMGLGNLSSLNLSGNEFSGDFPGNIGDLKGLMVLNMSGCRFSGRIPESLGNLLRLETIDLSKQNLTGELPLNLFGLPSLQVIALEENSFSGDVPEGFSSLSSLQHLNLSSNAFFGEIPTAYGFLTSLTVLSLANNQIGGSIPVDLSNCSNLEVLELRGNYLTGQIPSDFSHLSHLKKLDLGQNNLIGEIPADISNCLSLEILSLDSNNISGNIPDSLSRLSNLTSLDLSSNNLSGQIPESLSQISGLKHLNLSSNNLDGEIPASLASRFDASVFAMNKNLCGKPLNKKCGNARRQNRKRLILFIFVAVAGGLISFCCCCIYLYGLLRWSKKMREGALGEKKRSPSPKAEGVRGSGENGGPKLVLFNNKLTYAETLEATRQFDEENVLSRGRYGLLFKAVFADGMVLAIRRLPDTSIDINTFRKEAEALGKLKHRNLTVLRGYYAGPPSDVRLLIYDYMPNGNLGTLLQEALHQEGHVLNWPMRHLIGLGIARGLAFLHSVSMVHADVKPQNVLFDADFEAHLSDFGLDKLTTTTPAEASTSSTPVGTLGYASPEVRLMGLPTQEADTYSFGIVLLEILTGRKPVMFNQDEDIVKWVKRQLQTGQISELLERGLLELDSESPEWEEFLLGVKVGLLCTMPDPLERPSMADVVFMLEGCRAGQDIPSSADPTTLPSPI